MKETGAGGVGGERGDEREKERENKHSSTETSDQKNTAKTLKRRCLQTHSLNNTFTLKLQNKPQTLTC